MVALNLAHRAIKGRTAAVAAVLRAYDELVALGGKRVGGGGRTYMRSLATCAVSVSNACSGLLHLGMKSKQHLRFVSYFFASFQSGLNS